jgi:hypothetical protein
MWLASHGSAETTITGPSHVGDTKDFIVGHVDHVSNTIETSLIKLRHETGSQADV